MRALVLWTSVMAVWAGDRPKPPLGLPPLEWPGNNRYSAAKAELGRYLYFDPRLSVDGTVACATCHDPRYAFADGAPVSTGVGAQTGSRNAPSIINRGYAAAQFWDGRAQSLEEQALGPLGNPREMGGSREAAVARLAAIAGYRPLFGKAFGSEEIDIRRVAMAIACFERTVLSGNAPFDRYRHGEKSAMTPAQVRGMAVFFAKAKCDHCHEGPNFTMNTYANLGIGTEKPDPDVGRYAITKDPRDWGVFKVPALREVEHTAPSMHDGSLRTLREVVEFYDRGGIPNRNLDPSIRPLHLTEGEKADLVEFLKALSGEGWQEVRAPERLP